MAQEIIKEAAADKAAAYLDDNVNENYKSKGLNASRHCSSFLIARN